MLTSLFTESTSNISLIKIVICTLVSLVLGFIIAFTHKKTSKYSQNFLITLTILPTLVEIVILMVNGNLGTSIAILGAFSLVKFRSLPGTSKEILSVFFAMAIGLATGMGEIFFASVMTIIICGAILLFSYLPVFRTNPHDKILKITIPENLDYSQVFVDILQKYTNSYTLEQVKTTNLGSLFELSYRISLKKEVNEKEFIDDLRIQNGNLKIMLSQNINEMEM